MFGLGGGAGDNDKTILGRWRGSLHRLGTEVPLRLEVRLRLVRAAIGASDLRSRKHLRRWGKAVRGHFEIPDLLPDGWQQTTRLHVAHDGTDLVGYAWLNAAIEGVGAIERLSQPVRLVREED